MSTEHNSTDEKTVVSLAGFRLYELNKQTCFRLFYLSRPLDIGAPESARCYFTKAIRNILFLLWKYIKLLSSVITI